MDILEILEMAITIVCSVLASSGFWAYLMKKSDKNNDERKMLIGLAHDRIVCLGLGYITRGFITKDEYEDLHDYLYDPYEKLGGDGSAKKVMIEIDKLPMHN